MKSALFFFILLALVPFTWAQEPATGEAVEVTSVSVSAQSGEVRVEIRTSAPVLSPGSVVAYPNNLTLDLPGVVYTESAHRYVVNRVGIRDVRIWQQNQDPPLARISIELDKATAYVLANDSGVLVLRVGPGVQSLNQNASSRPGNRQPAAVSAGRPAAPARAAERIVGVFRRPEKQPEIVPPNQTPPNPATAQGQNPQPPLVFTPPVSEEQTTKAGIPLSPPATPQPATPPTATSAGLVPPSSPLGTSPNASESTGLKENAEANAPAPSSVAAQPEAPPAAAPVASPSAETLTPKVNAGIDTSVSLSAPSSIIPSASSVAPAIPSPVTTEAATETSTPDANTEPHVGGQPITSQGVGIAQTFVEIPNPDLRTEFHVKFVQQDTAYIDGGRSAGLAEGMKLIVKDTPTPAGGDASAPSADMVEAELVVVGVAETSAVTEIHLPKRDVVPGDVAVLSSQDTQALVQQHALGTTRKYPAVISFTEGADALDEEAHAEVPRPPLPSVNHARGRIGFDYIGTKSLDSSQFASRDVGLMLQADFTRIGGTYWNLNGFWHGQLNSASSAGQLQTLQDLINRTYHLGLTYDNPTGHWVAGFGRLYLPWASSLDTIDGGYFGRRVRPGIIVGMFAGSTPDPTSWNYNPNLRLGGAFVNFEGGSFDAFHYSSTAGGGVSLLVWQVNRPFVFTENSISYKRNFSVYHALQADSPAGNAAVTAPGPGIGRSFLTVRWSPIPRLQFDGNHTYFRDVPTFDPTLVGTGLLDKYLFQGFSGGAHVDIVKQISVYTELGRSNRTGDAQSSLNEMYGVTFGRIPLIDMRADVHYSRFNSSFGGGTYEALTLSRSFTQRFRLDVLAGNQAFTSTLAGNQSAHFLTATVDSSLGAQFFMESAFTLYRGQLQNYNQWLVTFGYRFDSKSRH